MTSRSTSMWAVAILLALGSLSLIVRENLKSEAGDNDYLLKYHAEFHVRKPDGRANVVPDARLFASIPETTRFCKVVGYKWEAPGMDEPHYRIHRAEARKNIMLRTTKTGPATCDITFRLHLDPNGDWRQSAGQAAISKEERHACLANAKGMTATSETAKEIVHRLSDNKPKDQELVHRIFEECRTNIESAGKLGEDSGDLTLTQQKGSPLGRARAMVVLCRAAGIPARLVTGFEIKKVEGEKVENVAPRYWVEAYFDDQWEPCDLEEGNEHGVPYNFLPVRRENVDPIRVTNATDMDFNYSVGGAPPLARTPFSILDLRHLSPKLIEPVKVVLVLPIGALFTAFVRTIVGIRTFGTFTPTLLALAFVYNDFNSGLVIFVVVLATGFISRGVLDRLKLLLVPRLSIILTLVVMLMVLGISVMNYFNRAPGGQTVLLPMVILTNLVERFYVTSEEDSFLYAMRLIITTMLMALAIYLLLNWRTLGNVLFEYPELHLFTVAILIVMGRYTGYRLTELVRFRDLVPRQQE